jgi:peptide/nickel transport system substrate-binding protein
MKVRRAVSLAIDREALIQGPYQGFGTPSKSGLSSGYDHDHASEYYTYNPERAKKLLAEAGYPNGFDFTLTYSPTRPGAHAEQVAILIADMLKKVGMRAKLNLIAGASEFEFTKKGPKESRGKARGYTSEMEAWIDFEGPAVVDPSYSMFLNNGCQSIWNNHGMCNEKYEDIMRKIKFLPSGPERRKLMSEAAVIVGEIQPWVYLIDIPYLRPETAKLKNWTAPANGELIVYRADLEK